MDGLQPMQLSLLVQVCGGDGVYTERHRSQFMIFLVVSLPSVHTYMWEC